MKPVSKVLAGLLPATLASTTALATNGDMLIGVGPIMRSMGGTGIAAPQDAISAVFANPAAMCFTPGCAYSEVNFGGTLFMPKVDANLTLATPGGVVQASGDSTKNVYAVPAIGISTPIDPQTRRWRFGLAAYGVTGLGVDYRGTPLDQPGFFPPPSPGMPSFPLIQGEFSSLMVMKFAPSVSYQVAPNLSFGVAAHIDYATLDLRNGGSPAYGFGAQLGVLWQPVKHLSVGATYTTPQATKFSQVVNYMGMPRDLELESPHTIGVGVAYSFLEDRLLVTAEGKWLNWADTKGYGDFDWQDQWVAGVGIQYAAIPKKLFLRVGYNFGENPLQENNGWSANPNDGQGRTVQGMFFPDYYYETFRSIGFPAIVEHHLTAGVGYAFSEKFELNVGYVHAFEKSFSETSAGGAARIESNLEEDSVELGFTWRF